MQGTSWPAAMMDAGAYSRRRVLRTALAWTGGAAAMWWLGGCTEKQGEKPAAQFWQRRLEMADGSILAVDGLRGRPLLVNLWATWCPPCVEEMPLLDAFHRQTAPDGWSTLGIALDTSPDKVHQFLRKTPVGFPVALCRDTAEARVLGAELGVQVDRIPLSLLIDSAGMIRQRRIGILSAADLEGWRAAIMAEQAGSR